MYTVYKVHNVHNARSVNSLYIWYDVCNANNMNNVHNEQNVNSVYNMSNVYIADNCATLLSSSVLPQEMYTQIDREIASSFVEYLFDGLFPADI